MTDFFSFVVDGKLSLGGLELQDLMLEIEERLRMERNLNAIFYVFSCTIEAVKTCLVFTVKSSFLSLLRFVYLQKVENFPCSFVRVLNQTHCVLNQSQLFEATF